uniref:Uncharacterized protein LOC102801722 n=1 Tax=Saccoglossus kowalevskii TaxID=10224 RepID=A0ABM0MNA6_SACKO|nr:PREDICTED: uncharacterized protein LOC102801722 [Saccoglossus kowalevskii]
MSYKELAYTQLNPTLLGNQNISGTPIFSNDVKVHGDIVITGLVNLVDVSVSDADTMTISGTQTVTAKTFMQDLSMLSDLTVGGEINGVDFDLEACTLNTVQNISGIKSFTELATIHGEIEAFRTIASLDFTEKVQSIDVTDARHMETFKMEGKTYLATTSYGFGINYCITSGIYEWNDVQSQFEIKWNEQTNRATRWHAFTIEDTQFLFIANGGTKTCSNVDYFISELLAYNTTVDDFISVQFIESYGSVDADTVEIDGYTYLAVANTISSYSHDFLFKYNTSSGQFDFYQEFETEATGGVEFVTILDDTYLIFGISESSTESPVYWFNGTDFELFQTITTYACSDVKQFELDDSVVLAIANELSIQSDQASYDSEITFYSWSNSESQFEKLDYSISVRAPSAIDEAVIGAYHYLAVASNHEDTFTLWKYCYSLGWQIQMTRTLKGLYSVKFVTIDEDVYIVLSSEDVATEVLKVHVIGGKAEIDHQFECSSLMANSWKRENLLHQP